MGSFVTVLVADDSPVFTGLLEDLLTDDPELRLAGVATNGADAVEKVHTLCPDVVLMDLHMPVMDGLDAVQTIMSSRPTPILMMTEDPRGADASWAFEALRRGALELLPKPSPDRAELVRLRERLLFLSGIRVVYHAARHARSQALAPPSRDRPRRLPPISPHERGADVAGHVVGLAASTGGPPVLAEILGGLPADLPAGVVIVQHLTAGFSGQLVAWLRSHSALPVKLAQDGALVRRGEVLLAPEHAHLLVGRDGRVRLSEGSPLRGHRPSASVLFTSLAESYGANATGVVLTGMGDDGCAGLARMQRAGARTLVQDEATCVVYGMPRRALESGAATEALPRDRLAAAIAWAVKAP